MYTGDLQPRLDVTRGMLPDDSRSNVELDYARRLQTGKVAGVTDPARTSFLAFMVVSWKDRNSGNDEYGANREYGRYTSHYRHVDFGLLVLLTSIY